MTERPPIVLLLAVWLVVLIGAGLSLNAAFWLFASPFVAVAHPEQALPTLALTNLLRLALFASISVGMGRYALRITEETLR